MSQAQSQRMSSGSAPGAGDPSLGQLFGDLARDVQSLFKQELALAKTETIRMKKTLEWQGLPRNRQTLQYAQR
jgi:hypothetical protein